MREFVVDLITFGMLILAIAGAIVVVDDMRVQRAEARAQQSAQTLKSVMTLADQVARARERCLEEGAESFSCYERYYERMVGVYGVKTAFGDLRARYEVSDLVKAQCHQLAHVIGHAATDLYPTPAQAFAHGDSFCWSGYYHGVMETVVEKAGGGDAPLVLDTLCSDMPGKERYSFDYYNCVHGLGHGVMTLLNGDLFESLKQCDTLSKPWEQGSCAGGVFMENVMRETRTGGSQYFKKDDLLYPCNAVGGTYKAQCFLMQSSHMLAATGYDWKRVFEACSTAPEGYRDTCYQSIGRDASGSTVSDAEKTKKICNLAPSVAQKEGCVTGAAKDFVSYYHSDVQAKKFCDAFETKVATACRELVVLYYRTF